MRKKFTMLLAALFLVMGTAWAQTVTIEGSTSVESPEHQYVMKSGNGYWMAANTAPTKHKLGRFAFFEVTETDNDANDYKIYSIDLQKWVSYNKAGSYSNGMEFAKLVDSQENAQPWSVEKKTVGGVGYYQITPYNNNGVAAKYMNWFGGIDASYYSYDDTKTVGLWQSGAGDDAGSRWTLAECLDFGSISDGGDIATTWTPSSWWTTNDAKGSNVLEAVKAVEDAQYSTGTSDVKMSYMHVVLPAGRLDITLNYSTGNNRLDILGLDLLNANGEVVVSDYHFGYTGNAKSLNTYTLPVETAGSYSLRYWVTFKSQINNSNGNIAIAHTSVAELKEAAKAELDKLAMLSIVTVGDAKAQVDAVEANPNASINAILVDVKKSVDGKNVRFTTYGRNATDGSDITAAPNGTFFTTNSGDAGIWTLKSNVDGTFKMYNFLSDLYLGVTTGDGSHLATCSDFAAAGSYTFNPIAENKTNLKNNGNALHADGWGKIVQWNPDHTTTEASIWTVVSCEPIAITREQYDDAVAAKAALPNAIQQAYGLVTDASKYSSNAPETDPAEKSSYANLLDNNYESYFHSAWSYGVDGKHYLQAEVSEEVKDFCFYFKKRHNTPNNRPTEIEILGSTDGTEFTPIATINSGLPTKETDVDYFSPEINATENVKYLRFVVKNTNTPDGKDKNGNLFFHFSEFYIFPAVSDVFSLFESYYSFGAKSITDEGIAEAANKLINAETTLALANIKKEANAILTANADKHEETPALGKYPTATYEALQNAYNNGTTEVEIRTAIDNFKASKNLPVFTIDGVIDYARGKSIYDNPGSTNAKGNTHYFKTTNEFDKTMWWALDLTAVDLTDSKINSPKSSVGIYNVGTGAGFWGASTIDITETSENDATDDIFLFYANGGNPIHAQKDGALITKWESQGRGSGSAWKFSYIGSTFELSKYDDAYVAAYAALETAYIGKRHLIDLFGSGVGQFGEGSEAFLAPLTAGGELLNVPLGTLLKEKTIADLQSATEGINNMPAMPDNTTNALNLPQDGQYFRIKGANDGKANYLTGNVTNNGNHIALQADADNATIFKYVGGKLLAVESNLYVAMTKDYYTFQLFAKDAPGITFAASSRKAGAYIIKSDRYFHYNSNNTEGTFLDRCSTDPGDHTAHDWFLEAVEAEDVPSNGLLTDIANLASDASYRIYGDRGFIYVADDGNMKSTYKQNSSPSYSPINAKHHFAVVTIGENKYLYNVGAKKFVNKNDKNVALTDYPEHPVVIEKASTPTGEYYWLLKLDSYLLNLTDAGGNAYGVYTSYNTEDPGNRWAIYKVGAFNPAEAESMKKVVVNYTIDGVASTETIGVAAGNAVNFSYEFATVTSCKMGEEAQTITDGACSVTIQDNVTISVAMTSDNRLFRLKNTASSKYMTIVTPEAAEGVQIKDKADDPVKQAFRIVLANWQGKYNIKSTENYFMASSTGGWDYGAYLTTTNEAGRVHELEALGEGKYGLKTLNGYAGPNKNATSDGSPLYSNHTADNNGREWELEEVAKSSITYIYKYGEEEITREVHENVYEGLAAPATAVTLPFGFSYDAASLPTTKGAGDEEEVIACELSLPFEYYDAFDNVEKWYYLRMHAESQNFLYYEEGATSLDATKTEVDAADKDAYTWAFVGDPINGFSVVNKKAGETFVLSSAVEPTADKEYPKMALVDTITTGNKVWDLYTSTSTDVENGFFMAYDGTTKRLNKQDGKVCYWLGGADNGSTFIVQERDLSGAVELQEYINEVTLFLEALGNGTATAVGYVTAESLADVNSAMADAETAIQNKENINEAEAALQNAVKNLKTIQPTEGVYYTIQNSYSNVYMNVAGNTGLKTTDAAGLGEVFQFVPAADGKFYMYNVERGTFLSTAKGHGGGQNQAGAVEQTSAVAVTIANLGAENHVSIVPEGGTTMHHDANLSTVVGWDGGLNTRSSWKIVEADLTGLTRTVTVGDFGYSTLYLNYATIVPEIEGEDNGVYVASEVASNYVALTQVEAGHVLPAKTGVIIKATKGDYTFTYSSEENNNVTSAFEGTLINEIITPEGTKCYVLANPKGENDQPKGVGLYIASLNKNNGQGFLNNANKVYLPVETPGQAAPALVMRFGRGQGTTEIELPTANGQQPTAVYDLQGRRVLNPTKGMYIVNGKKVLF